ncbi:MAG: hypothetical protein ABIS07_01970, partial [Dokdonella sp.]
NIAAEAAPTNQQTGWLGGYNVRRPLASGTHAETHYGRLFRPLFLEAAFSGRAAFCQSNAMRKKCPVGAALWEMFCGSGFSRDALDDCVTWAKHRG